MAMFRLRHEPRHPRGGAGGAAGAARAGNGGKDSAMTHLWVRAEQRANEDRVGLTPEGARALVAAGIRVTVETSRTRAIGIDGYR